MSEIELKLQVPPERRAAVAAAVAGSTGTKRMRLRAAYFDTADAALARAGLALRLRREGRRWVQTLKGAAADGMTRTEHNVVLATADLAGLAVDALPAVDPQRHAATEPGDRLLALLAERPSDALHCLYRTDIWRRTRVVRAAGGLVELAFDEGLIASGDRSVRICELEVELLSGSAQAVIATAGRWLVRHKLWLDTRSKAERGDLLARGLDMAPPCKAPLVPLTRQTTLPQARRLLVEGCLRQVGANAAQIASGASADEHVHQLRVGLRRLRTLLRLFGEDGAPLALPATVPSATQGMADAAAAWFRQLGAARDAAAVLLPLAGRLDQARAQVGAVVHAVAGAASVAAAGAPSGQPTGAAEHDPVRICRAAASQALLLALHAHVQQLAVAAPPPVAALEPAPAPLRDWFDQRLRRLHRKVRSDLRQLQSLDDAAVHLLRKRAKRLRYACEFAAPLYKAGAVRRYLRPLAALQDRLGSLNDLAVAIGRFRAETTGDAGSAGAEGGEAWFALGWLASQREAARAACAPAARALLKADGFWKAG